MAVNPPLLSQERLPRLWNLMQWTIGATIDKRKLVLLKYRGHKEVLGIGCSTGNVSRAFLKFKGLRYTGIDIDDQAIQIAKRSFRRRANFSFVCADLNVYAETTKSRYDYILFENVAHHIDDEMLRSMLCSARKLLSTGGIVVVVDPLQPASGDYWFIHWYRKLERGQHVRNFEHLKNVITSVPGLRLTDSENLLVGATPLSVPACSRFAVFSLTSSL